MTIGTDDFSIEYFGHKMSAELQETEPLEKLHLGENFDPIYLAGNLALNDTTDKEQNDPLVIISAPDVDGVRVVEMLVSAMNLLSILDAALKATEDQFDDESRKRISNRSNKRMILGLAKLSRVILNDCTKIKPEMLYHAYSAGNKITFNLNNQNISLLLSNKIVHEQE